MDNILDILCDYSVKGKEVDFKFLKHVFNILKIDNEDYVRKLKERNYNNCKLKKRYSCSYVLLFF